MLNSLKKACGSVLSFFVIAIIVTGCVPPKPAAISDISEDKVRVQKGGLTIYTNIDDEFMEDVWNQARFGCERYGKSPQLLSHKCLYGRSCETMEWLFACIKNN